jgi:hypothetical protein
MFREPVPTPPRPTAQYRQPEVLPKPKRASRDIATFSTRRPQQLASTSATSIMAHMARGEGYREEQTSDEDGIVARHGRGRALIGTDEYIES